MKKIALAAILACSSSFLMAEESTVEETIDQTQAAELPAVTVSAGRGSSLDKLDVNTTVMTREQVQQSPETTVEQILNKIPGVFSPQVPAKQIHPTGQVFSIRGFGTTTNINTLVMIDGIPVNDPYFRILNWGQIPKDAIEKIEVIRGGGASSLWGNLAMGGIVNIILREPIAGEKRVNVSYGSFNTLTADATATLYASDQFKLGLSVGSTNSDGYKLIPTKYSNPYMAATDSDSTNILLSAFYTPNQDSKYYAKLSRSVTNESDLVWNNTSNAWRKSQLTIGGSTKLSNTSSINLNGWYNRGEMDTQNAGQSPGYSIFNPSVAVPYVSQIEQAKYKSLGGSMFYQTDFSVIQDIKIGVDARHISAHDNEDFYNAVKHTSNILAVGEHNFQGLFAQAVYRPETIPLDITLGLREDFFQTADASITNTIAGVGSVKKLANQSYNQFDPRLGAKFYFDNGFDIRAAVYKNFAAPGMNQMYRSTQSGTNYLAPNADLTPQSNIGKEIGFDYKQAKLDVAFTLFYNNLSDYIDFAPMCTSLAACTPFTVGTGFTGITRVNQYVNAGDAVIKGAELIASWQATDDLQLNGGFTRTSAYLTRSLFPNNIGTTPAPDPIDAQLGQVPSWMANVGANWRVTPKLKLSLQVKSFPSYWNNTAHTQRNDAATIADAGFSYNVNKIWEIYGSAQNIGNRHYYDSGLTTTTRNGSTYTASALPALGMPLTINLGLKANF
jgi:outer membrane receptor protein involved in Fe transport